MDLFERLLSRDGAKKLDALTFDVIALALLSGTGDKSLTDDAGDESLTNDIGEGTLTEDGGTVPNRLMVSI
jgi:hypothetical protein